MRDILRSLGLAKVAGCLCSGEDTVRNAARGGRVKLVLLSSDAGSAAVKRAQQAQQSCGAAVKTLPCTKQELGGALGLTTVSICGVTDVGFAKMLSAKIDRLTNSSIEPA